MFIAVVTSRGVAKLTQSRDLSELVLEHFRARLRVTQGQVPIVMTRSQVEKVCASIINDAQTAIVEAIAAAERDARLKTVELDASHEAGDDRPFRPRTTLPRQTT